MARLSLSPKFLVMRSLPRLGSISRRLLPWSATAIVLAACATTPTVELKRVAIQGIAFAPPAIMLSAVINVNNKNGFDVMVRNVDATVTLNDHYTLPPIDLNPNVWLAANATTQLQIPVSIPLLMIPGLLTETVSSSSIKLHMKGTADVTATRLLGLQRNNEPIDQDTTIPRQSLLAALPVGVYAGP